MELSNFSLCKIINLLFGNSLFNFADAGAFCLPVGKDTHWVPLADLGNPKFSSQFLNELSFQSPETQRNFVSSAIDAITLLMNSNFIESVDFVLCEEEDLVWEHHKPGYYAILSKTGCCATAASWLTYFLNAYDSSGYISITRDSGFGHIIVYVLYQDWYYFIDPLLYTKDYVPTLIAETGQRKDYVTTQYITGCCIKAKSIEAWINFYKRYYKSSGQKHLFCKSSGDYVPPISIKRETGMIKIYIVESLTEPLYQNNDNIENLQYIKRPLPKKNIDWQKVIERDLQRI